MKGLKQFITYMLLLLLLNSSKAQLSQYSLHELDSLQKIQPKNMVIFIHTDWCRYCQAMRSATFQNEQVTYLLNTNFYFSELNAEDKQQKVFNGTTFKFQPSGVDTGIHELAEQLATVDGKVSFPSLCILNEDYEIIFQFAGFLSSEHMLDLLKAALMK